MRRTGKKKIPGLLWKSSSATVSVPVITGSSVHISQDEVDAIVKRIGGNLHPDYVEVPQDGRLANNQAEGIRCGDNGIFKRNAGHGGAESPLRDCQKCGITHIPRMGSTSLMRQG